MTEARPITPNAAPTPDTVVDHALVAEVRREVSDALAVRLREAPVADPRARRELARTLLTEVLVARSRDRVHAGQRPWTVDEEFAIADSVMDAIFGMGRLQPLIDDPSIENIEVTGYDNVWVAHADGREVRGEPVAGSDTELVELIQALVTRTGQAERSFSTASPSLHLRLDDGSRLTAMAWVTPRPVVVIRRHRVRDVSLDQMVEWGSMSRAVAEFLGAAIRAGKNVIVTGAQNAGKTTMLRALAAEFSPMERFATIEREYELHLHELTERHPRVVAMEARIGSSRAGCLGACLRRGDALGPGRRRPADERAPRHRRRGARAGGRPDAQRDERRRWLDVHAARADGGQGPGPDREPLPGAGRWR